MQAGDSKQSSFSLIIYTRSLLVRCIIFIQFFTVDDMPRALDIKLEMFSTKIYFSQYKFFLRQDEFTSVLSPDGKMNLLIFIILCLRVIMSICCLMFG